MPRECDTCHSCGKSGHWARQCPKKTAVNDGASTGDFVGANGKKYRRSLPCPCGAGSCKLFTSNTVKNPGRNFYRCPANDKSKCQFFKWADEVKLDEYINIPFCRCGADFCRVGTENVGPNTGRTFFTCPIKKGHGACDYKLWLDAEDLVAISAQMNESISSSPSTLTCTGVSPASSDVVEECDGRSRVGHKDTSLEDIYYHLNTSSATSGSLKSRKVDLEDLNGEDEVLDEPSRKHRKRLRFGELKVDDTSLLCSSGCLHSPAAKSRNFLAEERPLPETEVEIHPRLTELPKQILVEVSASGSFASSPAESFVSPIHLEAKMDWMITSIHQNLDLTLHGWWGRLAFPPPQSLMVPSLENFTASVFPPEPICILQDAITQVDASPATHPRSLLPTKVNIWSVLSVDQDVQLLGSVKNKPNGSSWEGGQSSMMRCSISKVFLQAADHLQSDLLTLLESMDIKDHETMIQEADATFAALDRLGVDRRHFSERVEAFISSASSLAEIECSISSDTETLLNHWMSEKLKLDELSHAHVEAINASTLAKQRLLKLNEEASVVRARLSQIEVELADCEVENSALQCSLEHISEEKKKSEESLSIASKELENAQELWKQREVKQNAAKAAYETARAMLRE